MQLFSSIGSYINHIANAISNITQSSAWGNFLVTAGTLATAYFAPIVGLLVTCFVMTVADMGYGIAVARKQHQKITSEKNWHGTLAKLWHEILLIGMARLVEFTIMDSDGVFVLTGGITVIISLTELWSIIENLNTLYPHGPWKLIGAFLKKKGEDYIDMTVDLDKNGHNDDNTVADTPQEDRR